MQEQVKRGCFFCAEPSSVAVMPGRYLRERMGEEPPVLILSLGL